MAFYCQLARGRAVAAGMASRSHVGSVSMLPTVARRSAAVGIASRSHAGSVTAASRLVHGRLHSTQAVEDPEAEAGRLEISQASNMMNIGLRRIFTDEHDAFRETCRKFYAEHIVPHSGAGGVWETQQHISREAWLKAGEYGLLGINCPERYGGLGASILEAAISWEECMYAEGSPSGPGFALHSDICIPYILHYGTEAQKERWIPSMCEGSTIAAIAMTEPGAGSDLQGLRTSAIKNADGTYLLNGSKTYITNGWLSDLAIVVAKTNPEAKGSAAMSLFLVDTTLPGFKKGNPLKKAGLKAQDTCELFFEDVVLPADALLGEEGRGFKYLMEELPQERLIIAVDCQARAENAFETTRTWCNDRVAFGKPLIAKQVVAHKLADMKTALSINRAFVDQCLLLHHEGRLDTSTASMAKMASTDLAWKICDDAVQLHGGMGFMWETSVARQLADTRVHRIYGGANEIMKELIARTCKTD